MNENLVKIGLVIISCALGVGWSIFSLHIIRQNVEARTGQTSSKKILPTVLMNILRWILLLVLLYFFVNAGILYALCFVISLTAAHFWQVIRMNKIANRPSPPDGKE
jgi:uncharacterized protein with PQ loop repeat